MQAELLNKLLATGVQHGASDIHFKCGEPPTYRVSGTLATLKANPLRPEDTKAIAEHIIRDPDVRSQLDRVQEYDTSYSLPGVSRFRVNVFRQRGSLSLILRIIPPTIPTIEQLGLPPVLAKVAAFERGLVLVTGATGSGKSSTLAAMISLINQTRRCHILTIEDPIEFIHKNINASISQREIGMDTGSFTVALRAALRQDPDVILVGEMRDTESIDIALKASETGHMVFSTVHTTDAVKTIGRLISVFPPNEQRMVRNRLAENLRATISQRLLKRADTGGRVPALEIMIVTRTISDYIRDPDQTAMITENIEKGRTQYGMQTFDQHLSDLYRGGLIALETALEAATNPTDFQRALTYSDR